MSSNYRSMLMFRKMARGIEVRETPCRNAKQKLLVILTVRLFEKFFSFLVQISSCRDACHFYAFEMFYNPTTALQWLLCNCDVPSAQTSSSCQTKTQLYFLKFFGRNKFSKRPVKVGRNKLHDPWVLSCFFLICTKVSSYHVHLNSIIKSEGHKTRF